MRKLLLHSYYKEKLDQSISKCTQIHVFSTANIWFRVSGEGKNTEVKTHAMQFKFAVGFKICHLLNGSGWFDRNVCLETHHSSGIGHSEGGLLPPSCDEAAVLLHLVQQLPHRLAVIGDFAFLQECF